MIGMGVFDYKRRRTVTVHIGEVPLGSEYPIRLQSMASTSTMDTEGSVAQARRIASAGADYIRFTTQGIREVDNLAKIKERLRDRGVDAPLVADIHFNPKAAFAAARVVEKVRINPGNFADPARRFRKFSYTDEEYAAEIKRIEEALVPLLDLCRARSTAIRIGVNHGSLSDRIMSRYGDTPAGMVASAMEYLRICRAHDFLDVVVSIKSSNTVVMVETVRRLVKAMDEEGMRFPLHLGVTEAGAGEDGRIKSAVGIGTLLAEGIGDTIRVSLSEDPENEIPVAATLANHISKLSGAPKIRGSYAPGYCREAPGRRASTKVGDIGGGCPPVVVADGFSGDYPEGCVPDYFYIGAAADIPPGVSPSRVILPAERGVSSAAYCRLFSWEQRRLADGVEAPVKFVLADASLEVEELASFTESHPRAVMVLSSRHPNAVGQMQAAAHAMTRRGIRNPIILRKDYGDIPDGDLVVKASADLGAMLVNGLRDGLWIGSATATPELRGRLSFGILQAVRLRVSRTEFISCPGCGRTLFDLQSTLGGIKDATSHLKGLKIGVMGCIVNGPGEMADADYGYVGAAVGHVSLYKGKECVEKNIPQDRAIDKLIALIKASGDWTEPKN